MSEFKGFDDWVPIFRGGKQVDSRGIEHDGDRLIDLAVSTFNPKHHEPPACVGHPKDNAPAYAWVEGLKKAGSTLYAKFKDVVPEFGSAVKQGLYKKRSASFYPDGRLRHVGFLGAAPPAVKGLADMAFTDDDALTFDFYDPGMSAVGRIFRGLRDWLIEKEGKEKADEIIPDWDVDYIRDKATEEETQTGAEPAFSGATSVIDNRSHAAKEKKEDVQMTVFTEKLKNLLNFMGVDMSKVPDDALPTKAPEGMAASAFTKADIDAAKKKAEEETREKVEAEFAEKARKGQREARRREISNWCDTMVKEGKLTPALVKYGVSEILSFLADSDDVVEFKEADEKATAFDRLKGLFETELPKLVDFGEVARRGDVDAGDGTAGDKLDMLIKKKMADNKDLNYSAAFNEVCGENPDLANEYDQEIRTAA